MFGAVEVCAVEDGGAEGRVRGVLVACRAWGWCGFNDC